MSKSNQTIKDLTLSDLKEIALLTNKEDAIMIELRVPKTRILSLSKKIEMEFVPNKEILYNAVCEVNGMKFKLISSGKEK